MNKEELLEFYNEYCNKCNAYRLALSTMEFDYLTIAPINGSEYRIKMMSLLSGELFEYQTDPKNIEKLRLLGDMDLGELMNKEMKLVLKNVNKTALLPKEFFIKMNQTFASSEVAWRKAKEAKDYSLFKDHLKNNVEVMKQAYTYYGHENDLYDAMLDDYETGMNMVKYDEFFDTIKERLVPFVKKLLDSGKVIDESPLNQHFDAHNQEKLMYILLDYMGYDPKESYMCTTEHPFTSKFSAHDCRITVNYHEDHIASAIFACIHEYGHCIDGLGTHEKYEGLELSRAGTAGMGESQSRFLENYIGKRRAYWVNNYPKLQELYPDQLNDLLLDDFMKIINVSKPSLIRIEADELTYPLHILIRYELEKQMFNNEIDYDHLDELWADKYEEYLGVRPQNASEGILQDIHWANAYFGYFPTYAVGSAFSAQFFKTLMEDIDVDALV